MSARPRWLLPAAFVLLGLIWGSSFAWIKVAVDEIPPATLVAWRMTLGAIGMVALLALVRIPWPRTAGEWLPLAVLGAINAAIPIFLISWGEQFVDSGTAAVLNSLVPIFSLIIAGLALRTEPVTALRVGGLVLGFIGAALLASRELSLRADASGLIGVVPSELDTLVAVAWLGILGSFVAYVLFFFLIENLGATLATMVTYMFPVVGVAIGVLLLHERMDARLLIGTSFVLVGIIVVSLRYDPAVSRVPGGVRQ
jgi:drug/metabolite transporter (DMT)-like permease